MKKLVLLLAGVLGVAAAWYFLLGGDSRAERTRFLTVPVVLGSVEDTVLASGLVKPTRLVALELNAAGRISALPVRTGQRVAAGDLVAQIDSTRQRNALRTAESSLQGLLAQREEKEATLTLNQQTLARYSALSEGGVARADIENAQATHLATQAQLRLLGTQIEQAEIDVENARSDLDDTDVISPIDGTVLSVLVQEGQSMQSASTIAIIAQLDTMRVWAEVSEADIEKVRPGLDVWFTTLGNSTRRFQGILTEVAPAPASVSNDSLLTGTETNATSEAIYYDAILDVDNQNGLLRTYMTAQVNIVLGRVDDVPTIPVSSLGERAADGRYPVRVVDAEGVATERLVEVGLNDSVTAEVLGGLALGEKVVVGDAATAPPPSTGGFGPPPVAGGA